MTHLQPSYIGPTRLNKPCDEDGCTKTATYDDYCEEHAPPGKVFTGERRINSPRHGIVYLSGPDQENKQSQKISSSNAWNDLKCAGKYYAKRLGCGSCIRDSDFKSKKSRRKSLKKPVKKPVKKALQKTPKKPVKKTPKKASKTSKKSHARRV